MKTLWDLCEAYPRLNHPEKPPYHLENVETAASKHRGSRYIPPQDATPFSKNPQSLNPKPITN